MHGYIIVWLDFVVKSIGNGIRSGLTPFVVVVCMSCKVALSSYILPCQSVYNSYNIIQAMSILWLDFVV